MPNYRKILIAYMRTIAREEGKLYVSALRVNARELGLDAADLTEFREIAGEIEDLEKDFLE